MEEMTVRKGAYPALLDGYVKQGQMFLMNAAQNLIQYGRVLTEAKPLVPHGQFGKWVQENFNMSERSAQGYMAVWRRFGENESLNRLQFSNLQKMLSLPEGSEEDFARQNDIENMTARQVAEAVAKVRQEEREKTNKALADAKEAITKARNEQAAALRQAAKADELRRAAEQNAGENPEQARRIRDLEAKLDAAALDADNARAELEDVKAELEETEGMLAQSQKEYDRVQGELLNVQSAAARGDADRTISEQLTGEDFAAAVRLFLGSVAQMPYMGGSFAQLADGKEYRQWDELLQAVEDWARRARRALDGRSAVIDG